MTGLILTWDIYSSIRITTPFECAITPISIYRTSLIKYYELTSKFAQVTFGMNINPIDDVVHKIIKLDCDAKLASKIKSDTAPTMTPVQLKTKIL